MIPVVCPATPAVACAFASEDARIQIGDTYEGEWRGSMGYTLVVVGFAQKTCGEAKRNVIFAELHEDDDSDFGDDSALYVRREADDDNVLSTLIRGYKNRIKTLETRIELLEHEWKQQALIAKSKSAPQKKHGSRRGHMGAERPTKKGST